MTLVATSAWAFVLLVVSVPLAVLLLMTAIGLAWIRRRRAPRGRPPP
jgi:hypothetical protein